MQLAYDIDPAVAPEESSFMKAQETLHYVNEDIVVECPATYIISCHLVFAFL